jgi:hypothetical protein
LRLVQTAPKNYGRLVARTPCLLKPHNLNKLHSTKAKKELRSPNNNLVATIVVKQIASHPTVHSFNSVKVKFYDILIAHCIKAQWFSMI